MPQLLQLLANLPMQHNKKELDDCTASFAYASSTTWELLDRGTQDKYIQSEFQPSKHTNNNHNQLEIHNKSISNSFSQISLFDKLEDIQIQQSVEQKIIGLNLKVFTSKRKDQLFKRFKKQQELKLMERKREVERAYSLKSESWKLTKSQFQLKNQLTGKTQIFPITADDMEKLKPQGQLNDTIVGNYIKLLQFAFLPQEIQQKVFIFSSFFLQKLIGEYVKEQSIIDKDPNLLIQLIRNKVRQNYKNVKRWTKKIDIFGKDILVFPINAFRHWFCLIVLRPSLLIASSTSQKCEIIYCDSMFERREFIVEAIMKYLQYQKEQKKSNMLGIDESKIACYQLLLPRQTNTHDCGFYMISYIEELLLRSQELKNLKDIKNRKKLSLFPRTLIFTMRDRLRKLFTRLINSRDENEKMEVLEDYKKQKAKIIKEAEKADFDEISQNQYKKYEKMNLHLYNIPELSTQERYYSCEIRFYLDSQINYYQKDK